MYQQYGKRSVDIILSLAMLLLAWPLLLALAAVVRLALGSPILFRQVRPGRHEEPFTIFKFRTMTNARDKQGDLLPDAERLTRFGQFLRSSSLDEAPELFNVLRGDMSFVGPRPLLMQYLPHYSEEQRYRHDVRPGITGWAQVNGRNAISWEEKFELDVWYVEHCSLWLDIRIIAQTILQLVRADDINAPGHATMYYFTGSPSVPNLQTQEDKTRI